MDHINEWKPPMIQVNNRIDKLELLIQNLGTGTGEGMDMSLFKDLEGKIQLLRDDFEKFKNDVLSWLKELQDLLNQKADIDMLKELEKELLQRIEDLVNAFTKQFADKNETKKALKALEKQIKNLYELLMSRQSPSKDDAMFSKRPLLGNSCASCEKDLVNLQGIQADYTPWKQFPFRDPNDRIAKVGQGFSRMLSMMKPEYVMRYNGSGTLEQQNMAASMDEF